MQNNNKYIVYCHITPNGKKYIGITSIGMHKRFANGKGYRTQKVFYRAIQKYGWENIRHIVLLDNLDRESAKQCEKYYIALYKTNCNRYNNPSFGYNMTDGGDTGTVGLHLSEEHKQKLREINKKRRTPISYFDLNGNYIGTANTYNEAQIITGIPKENILKAVKGRIKSCGGYQFRYFIKEDVKNGIDRYKINKNHFTKYNVPVYQYSLDGIFIRCFRNPRIAEKETGFKSGHIIECAKGIYNVSYGFVWSFEKHKTIDKRNNCPTYPKSVCQYDIEGNYLNTFYSISDACKAIEKPNGRWNITKALKGERKIAYGYKWKYACVSGTFDEKFVV